MRILQLTLEEALEISKALGNAQRMEMMKHLTDGPMNVNEIAERMGVPFSAAAVNIKKLEAAGLISAEMVPGRGSQKVSSKKYDRIVIDLEEKQVQKDRTITVDMPIGEYAACEVEPTCGLAGEKGILHVLDEPRSFFEPERKDAQLIWFKHGYVEYHFPNRLPYGAKVEEVSVSAELCSEAPYHKLDWPSDITCWMNGIEIGTWTSPSDFGGQRGFITPLWWEEHNTQYGLLKNWKVTSEGSFIDGKSLSPIVTEDLKLNQRPYIAVRFGVKKEAANAGGMNIFGRKFGNYEQDLQLKIKYM